MRLSRGGVKRREEWLQRGKRTENEWEVFVTEMTGRKLWGNGPWIEHREREGIEGKRIKLMRERREWCWVGYEGRDFPLWINTETNAHVYSSRSCKSSNLHLLTSRCTWSPSARGADQKTLIKHDRITQINLNLHPTAVIPDVLHFIFVDVPHTQKKKSALFYFQLSSGENGNI